MVNEEKIEIAIKRMSEMFKELDLTLEEMNIVTESGYMATKNA